MPWDTFRDQPLLLLIRVTDIGRGSLVAGPRQITWC